MFSLLQRHILKECFARKKDKVKRGAFATFYPVKSPQPGASAKGGGFNRINRKNQIDTLTKCLERLINRGLLVGYGTRTREKWFIREVRMTPLGRREWVKWIASRQAKLPF